MLRTVITILAIMIALVTGFHEIFIIKRDSPIKMARREKLSYFRWSLAMIVAILGLIWAIWGSVP